MYPLRITKLGFSFHSSLAILRPIGPQHSRACAHTHTPPTLQVRSLKAQLDTVTSELDSVHKLSRDREGVLTQQVEELKQEKNLREKDLEVTR